MYGSINAKGSANINLQRKRIALYDSLQRNSFTAYLQLLMDFEAGFAIDQSPHAHSIVQVGSAAPSATQSKFGAKSLFLPGSSYLTTTSTDLVILTQDFTFDTWVWFTSLGSQTFILDSRLATGTASGICIYQTSGKIVYYDGSSALITSVATLAINAWHHVEIDRKSGVVYLFVDGILQGAATDAASKSSNAYVIGAGQFFPIGVSAMVGYLDELRLLIGISANTTTFSPPSGPY